MSDAIQPAGELTGEAWKRRENLLGRFEDAWQSGQRPEIQDYLPDDAAARWAILIELVHIDLECRIKTGEAARVEEYLQRFAELAGDREAVFKLLTAEYQLRQRHEKGLRLDEYVTRFPEFAEELRPNQSTPPSTIDTPQSEPPPGSASEAITELQGTEVHPEQERDELPQVPGYEVMARLARTGMSLVYQARQLRPSRPVALKMIRAGIHAGEQELARFQREASAVARLQHPNIVQIYEVGELQGRPYLSLEFMEGGSLAKYLAGQPQPPTAAAALVEILARAVHFAHLRGILHRDLKPANILLMRESRARTAASGPGNLLAAFLPKITDFGLAKYLDGAAGESGVGHLTQSGAILGTPPYMAPEQADGKVRAVGPAADIYALGAILYELLTGRPPFQAETPLATLEQVRTQDPQPPTRSQPRVPHDLETICLKCLRKDVAARYASAEALADDLHRFLAGVPIQARPVGHVERSWRWCRRNSLVASLLTSLVIVLGILIIVLCQRHFTDGARESNPNAITKPPTRESITPETPNFYPLEEHGKSVLSVAYSPNGELLATAGSDKDVILWEVKKGGKRWEKKCTFRGHTGAVHCIAFSSDGHYLASASEDFTARIWNIQTEKEERVIKAVNNWVKSIAFSRESQRELPGLCASLLGEMGSPAGPGPFGAAAALLTGRSSHQLAVATYSGKGSFVTVWNPNDPEPLFTFRGHQDPVESVTFNPLDHRIISASRDQMVKIWNPKTGVIIFDSRYHSSAIKRVVCRPDGRYFATADEGGTVLVWNYATRDKQDPISLPSAHGGQLYDIALSPGDARLVTSGADQTIRIWKWDWIEKTIELSRVFKLPSGVNARCVATHPEGRQLAVGCEDNTVRVWNLD